MISSMIQKVVDFFKKEDGAGLAEYALLLVLIAIVCIIALGALGLGISGVFDTITAAL